MKQGKFYLLFLLLLLCAFQGVYAAGAKPPTVWGKEGTSGNKDKAYEDNWYKESSTTFTLTIGNTNQLGSFVKALNDKKTFEGQTVELTANLDMSKYQWASSETLFKGFFKGNGYTISNVKYGGDSSPWAFIGNVDGGEVNNVIISGDFKGNGVIGGIVGKLTNGGKITNSGFIGGLNSATPAEGAQAQLGGVVGVNDGGTVDNCFFTGSIAELADNTIIGNIAASSTAESITNSYFKENILSSLSIGNVVESDGVGLKSSEAFASGEVSWILNQTNDEYLKWSMNETLPTFATADNQAIFKVSYLDAEEGKVDGSTYIKAGTEVLLKAIPSDGYLGSGFTVTGAEVIVEGGRFIMPTADISVLGSFVEYVAPVVSEATEVESSSFVANWSAAEQGATEYFLTVTTADGTILDAYNKLSVGDVTSYEVTNLLPETTYKYTVQAKYAESVSNASPEVSVTTIVGPVISYSPLVSAFKIDRKPSASQVIKVVGSNLTSAISLVFSGDNVDNFSLSANTLPATGGDLTITYNSSELGTHAAILTLSSGGAGNVVVNLNGAAELVAPQPMVTAIAKNSFSVRWNAIPLAESYLVTLTQNGTVVEGYDNVSTTETGFEFQGLKANTAYIYTVTAVRGAIRLSGEANTITTGNEYGYGQQLNNSGFENWEGEGDMAEPVDWNSFMTCKASGLTEMARTQHMDLSKDVRPKSAGQNSTRIWTKNAVVTLANGNLTCGQINAGSTDPLNVSNNNNTIVGSPEFSEAMNGAKPDSLTVWVKYNPKVTTDQARVAAIIHDAYNFQDPTNGPDNDKHIVAKAALDYSATADKGWQRLTIPFRYIGPATSSDYMLVTFTSNKTPGKGSEDDEVYIDDMLLVYNPKVAVASLDKASYAQGGEIAVKYTLEGTMSPYNQDGEPNVVTLQLSDVNGSFEIPTDLASVTTDASGTLIGTLPVDLPVGKGYRVRVVTTNYPMISAPNANDIRVYVPGEANVSSTMPEVFSTVAGTPVQQTIVVEGASLSDDITVSLDKADQGFSILDVTTLPADGGNLVVTYAPEIIGTNAAVITLNSKGLEEPVLIELSGVSRPVAPAISAATNIIPTGFTANWEAVTNAAKYELTVTPTEGIAIVKSLDAVTIYDVTSLSVATGYTYHVTAIVDGISSAISEESELITTLNKPVIGVDKTSLTFAKTSVGESSVTQTITINATDLFGDINVAVTGQDYTVSSMTIAKDAENKTIDVTLTPLTSSNYCNATLTLTTEYGESVTVALSGSAIPETTIAKDGNEVTSSSFIAGWEAIGVTDVVYKLTVEKDGEPLADYNPKRVRNGATTYKVENLEPNATYTYSVVVTVSNLDSKPSNEVTVTTLAATGIEGVSSNLTVYPSPVNDVLYVKGCEAKEISIYSVDGMYVARYAVEVDRVDVSSLAAGVYFIAVTDVDGQVYKTRIVKK